MGRGDRRSVRWVKDRTRKKKASEKRKELERAEARKATKRRK